MSYFPFSKDEKNQSTIIIIIFVECMSPTEKCVVAIELTSQVSVAWSNWRTLADNGFNKATTESAPIE